MNKPKSTYSTDSYNPYPKRKSIFKRLNRRIYETLRNEDLETNC